MILIKPGEGATIITFPSIEKSIKKILLRWYSKEKTEQYAGNVQRFFNENAKFPKDGVYKLEDEVFYLLNIQNCVWEKTKNTKKSYVISDENSKFWEEFEKKLPYLMTYKADIQQIIHDTTATMFDVVVQKTSFVSLGTKVEATLGINDGSAIKAAISNYVNPQEQDAYIARILAEVFHSDDMPIFVIEEGITVAVITSNSIFTDVSDNALLDLLKKSFSANDAQFLQIRILNGIKYGINSEEEVTINENGRLLYNIGGLHVLPFGDYDKYCLVVQDKNNTQLFSKILEQQIGYHNGFTQYFGFKNGYCVGYYYEWNNEYSVTFNGYTCSVQLTFNDFFNNISLDEKIISTHEQNGVFTINKENPGYEGARGIILRNKKAS